MLYNQLTGFTSPISTIMSALVTIDSHTTASLPRPHILYTIQLTREGKRTVVDRRYSEVRWKAPSHS